MKSKLLLAAVCCILASCNTDKWILDWSEEFEGTSLDESVWSRTDRGRSDWQNTQSKRPELLEVRDGILILKGIVNDNRVRPEDLPGGRISIEADTAQFLTGGVVTNGKKSFAPEGRIEVRARLHGAQGAWPAIWLMPFGKDAPGWPKGGEIDIMERLNFEDIAHQTVHSSYTHYVKAKDKPQDGATGKIDPDDWNIYGVEFHTDSLTFTINGARTFSYPRLEDPQAAEAGQFPFIRPWHMLIDMQLGGSWVGEVDPAQLPVEMEVDWVRHYMRKKRK